MGRAPESAGGEPSIRGYIVSSPGVTDSVRRICLVSASGQNVFFGEILDVFGDALRDRGFEIENSIDCFPAPAEDLICLFIPHEYVALVDPLVHPTPAQLLRSVAVCTEQPGTNWFETSVEFAARAGAVIDINALGSREMNRRGIATEHAHIGYVPGWDTWGGHDQGVRERPIDMAFLGRHTDQRAQVVAHCAPALAQRRAAIYMTETIRPHVAGSSYFLAGRRRSELLADSKILLNVHQQDFPYLEWHRVLSAILNGCVVLTEHSLMTAPLEPGTHFISARRDDLPLVLEGLLSDTRRLEEVRGAAYALLREQMPASATADVAMDAIDRAAANPLPASSLAHPTPVPMPKEASRPKPGWEAYVDEMGDQLAIRKGLMDLVLRSRRLERRVEQLLGAGREADEVLVEHLGPELKRPRVSVLLTVYNHADLVGAALRSVAFSSLRDVEVIAVDDASTDGSADAVRKACLETPWLTTRLVRHSVNSGLPAVARNMALQHARADLVFVLDADNSVSPLGLSKLVDAMDADAEAAFAYGIIETFDATGPVGLLSWMDWDPKSLRYGNYIDAMAMIRRSALETVGGYPTQQALAGWEDFALWLAMAEEGLRGIRLPDFIGRYQVSQHSMLSITGIDHSAAWTTVMRKYPKTLGTGAKRAA